MPRQLPWLNKGAGSRTQVKAPPKARASTSIPSHLDDDFFDGAALADSSKGKAKAVPCVEDSDDDLPSLPAEPSTPRTKRNAKSTQRNSRATSSSPPPIQDHVQPEIEYMRAGASKFDLRDDEWMMVEDEFLETAKLFTRHLHIAEYEKLKQRIETKKKEQVKAARPVVLGGKMSVEGSMKKKAEIQEERQIKAIRDVFVSQDDDEGEEAETSTSKLPTSKAATASSSRASTAVKRASFPAAGGSDSDDLDARPIKKPTVVRPPAASALSSGMSAGQNSALPATQPTEAPASSFTKPSIPSARQQVASRKSRATPFDMLDGYVPAAKAPRAHSELETSGNLQRADSTAATKRTATGERLASSKTYDRSSAPISATVAPKASKPVDVSEAWGAGSSISKATAERLARKKAEREKQRRNSEQSDVLDDIPTFLV